MKLFVAGLPYDFDDTDLQEMFELYGTVASAKVALDRETKKSRGFGFLDMPNDSEGKDAINAMNNTKLKGGKVLSVKISEEKPKTFGGGGGYGNSGGNSSRGGYGNSGGNSGGGYGNSGGGYNRNSRDY